MASPGIMSVGPPLAEKQAIHIGAMHYVKGSELESLLLVKRLQSSFCAGVHLSVGVARSHATAAC